MHEQSLMADLIRKVTLVAQEHGAKKVTRVTVTLGALCHLSADHIQEHFVQAAFGTVADGAQLQINVRTDIHEPHAQELIMESVEIEEDT